MLILLRSVHPGPSSGHLSTDQSAFLLSTTSKKCLLQDYMYNREGFKQSDKQDVVYSNKEKINKKKKEKKSNMGHSKSKRRGLLRSFHPHHKKNRVSRTTALTTCMSHRLSIVIVSTNRNSHTPQTTSKALTSRTTYPESHPLSHSFRIIIKKKFSPAGARITENAAKQTYF